MTPELSGLPYTCYLYAALDISTRYKVGLILPKVDEAGSLLALYHATQTLPFPVCYVQTDNGLEFQRRFHAKCEEVGLGPVHTKQLEFDTIQVWKLQKLSTNA